MASDNETVAEIVKRVRRDCNSYPLPNAAGEKLKLIREIDDAHKREMADEKRIFDAVIQSLRDKKLEMAGEIAAKEAEIAELRECLREAVREKCPFTRMSCKHGEPCDYECGTFKWRKALGEAGGEE